MFDATPDADSSQPPRRRTQAQIEASRSNGARGRGPATPAGKAASCQNAAKHGLRAQTNPSPPRALSRRYRRRTNEPRRGRLPAVRVASSIRKVTVPSRM